MTEKEKKEIEEAEAAKKLKKGGKKDTKFEVLYKIIQSPQNLHLKKKRQDY